jgi:hypothetical protein
MDNKINIYKQARLAYLLSSCRKLFHAIFKKIIEQYQGENLVAIRSNFDVYLTFENNSKSFTVSRLACKFLNLTENETIRVFSPYIKKGHDHNRHNCTIWHIKALIDRFKNHKYIMVPVSINYNISGAMGHQSMIIINIQDKIFMFYEPYGKYSKFDMDYKDAVLDLFKSSIGGEFAYTTYHEYYKLERGIQTILLDKNNAKPNFELDLANIKKGIKNVGHESYLKDSVDKTIECMNLIHNAELDIFNDNETYKKALELYYNYNSKTCVSITLVEMNNFLDTVSKNTFDTSKSYFDTYTNEKLMQEIYDLTIKFTNSKKIDVYLTDTTCDSQFICNKIFI